MPSNKKLKPVKLPMKIRFGEKPKTEFVNNLCSINVKLLSAPTITQLKSYIPDFVLATWEESENKIYTEKEKKQALKEMFEGKTLPTALETINLVFKISGISLQEVTHILRHRNFSFSADCSGDKWWSHKDSLVPESIQNSPEFYERYKKITEEAKTLYCDMIDSEKISIMDARYILPRNLSTFYYIRCNLKDCLAFINQRKDVQIQPETDNIMAYAMFDALLTVYGGYVSKMVDFSNPSPFYQKMARTGKATNLYFPEPEVDNFEWNPDDFIYQCRREELSGTEPSNFSVFKHIQKYYFERFKCYGVKVPDWVR